MNDVILLIPAYQPSDVLLELLTKVLALNSDSVFSKIFVLNDGSGTEYEHIFEKIKNLEGWKF